MKVSFASLLVCLTSSYAFASSSYQPATRHRALAGWSDSSPARHLFPANLPSTLRRRYSISDLFKKKADFDFVDDSSNFITTITTGGRHPILALEDIEDDLEGISCTGSEIELYFSSAEKFDELKNQLETLDGSDFIVVTSHLNCNAEDQRAPHIVKDVVINSDAKSVTFTTIESEWKDAFDSLKVSFSRSPSTHMARRHHGIVARQETATSTTASTAPEPSGPTKAFPSPTGTATALPSAAEDQIEASFIDQVILPPDTPVNGLLNIPEGVTIKCKNCSIEGNVDLSQGSFTIEDSDGMLDSANATLAFIDHGEIQLDVQGFHAHIELELELEAGIDLLNFSVPLPSIPITPFAIPGVVQFGISFTPQILTSLTLSQSLGFSYGFNLTVPDDAGFTIEVGELGNSSIRGFQDTTFSALPFQAAQGVTNLLFTLSFTPEFLLGITSPVGGVTGGVGMFMNLPQLAVNITQLDEVDENCDPLPQSDDDDEDSEGDTLDSTLDKLVGNFTNIVASAELNLGAFIEAEIALGGVERSTGLEVTVASTIFTLPTACLAFDEENGSYGSPVEILATPTDGPGAKGEKDGEVKGDSQEGAAARFGSEEMWTSLWICFVVAVAFTGVGVAS